MTTLPSSARTGRRGTIMEGPGSKGKSRLSGENIKEKQVSHIMLSIVNVSSGICMLSGSIIFGYTLLYKTLWSCSMSAMYSCISTHHEFRNSVYAGISYQRSGRSTKKLIDKFLHY